MICGECAVKSRKRCIANFLITPQNGAGEWKIRHKAETWDFYMEMDKTIFDA